MDSEKATAVSPSSPLRARGPSVLDLLRGAATPTNSGQARRTDREQKTTKSRRKEKRQETDQFSLLAPPRQCACVRADTLIDNRFYVVFSPCSKEVAHLFF